MKRSTFLFLCMVIVVAGFFLPWVQLHSGSAADISRGIEAQEMVAVDGLRGVDIPMALNRGTRGFLLSFLNVFSSKFGQVKLMAWAVYLVPVGAVLIFLYARSKSNFLPNFLMSIVGIGVFMLFIYKFFTAGANGGFIHVRAGIGLWLSMLGYLGMGYAGLKYSLLNLKRFLV